MSGRGTGRRRVALVATALALTVGSWTGAQLTGGGQAHALTPPVAMTADDLSTWQTNGVVWALAQYDGVVYAGGTFSAVRPPGAAAGEKEQPALNFAAFDASTGAPTGDCSLSFTVGSGTATVRALTVSPDGKTLYAGGRFGGVNGVPVSNLAAISLPDCTVKSGFKAGISATVRTLDATADTLYLGGDFTSVDNQKRDYFAAVSTSGDLRSWQADADRPGRALTVTPDGKSVVLGGDFFTIRGQDSHALAVVDAATGELRKRYPLGFYPKTSVVKGLATDSTGFYTGSEGTGSGVFDGRTAFDLSDFDQRWRDTCLGATQDVLVYRSVVYSASHAHDCSSMGEFSDLNERQHLLAEPVDSPKLLSWFPDTDDGPSGTEQIGPRTMVVSAAGGQDYLWVGGEFTRMTSGGIRPQQGLVRFSTGPDTGRPYAPDEVDASRTFTNNVQVSWRAGWDRDDRTLTYRVYRDDSDKPICTTTADSTFWDRPTLRFTDDTVDSGTTYSYRVTASDAGDTNTSVRSDAASATTWGVPSQSTVDLEPSADTYVNGAATSANYGGDQKVAVRGSSAYETYLRFDLPDAPSGMALTSARLTVHTSGDSFAGSGDAVQARTVTGSWSESTVTYATKPALSPTVLGTLDRAPETGTDYTMTLDAGALSGALGGSYDIALTGNGSDSLWLMASESGGSSVPRLTLTYEAR